MYGNGIQVRLRTSPGHVASVLREGLHGLQPDLELVGEGEAEGTPNAKAMPASVHSSATAAEQVHSLQKLIWGGDSDPL